MRAGDCDPEESATKQHMFYALRESPKKEEIYESIPYVL